MRAATPKTAKLRRDAAPIRAAYILAHPACEIASPVCLGRSQHCHERLPRSQGGSLTDPSNLMAACDPCNDYVSDHPAWGYERGYLARRYPA